MSTKYRAGIVGAAYRCNSRQASLLKHLLLRVQHQTVKFSKLLLPESKKFFSPSYIKKNKEWTQAVWQGYTLWLVVGRTRFRRAFPNLSFYQNLKKFLFSAKKYQKTEWKK